MWVWVWVSRERAIGCGGVGGRESAVGCGWVDGRERAVGCRWVGARERELLGVGECVQGELFQAAQTTAINHAQVYGCGCGCPRETIPHTPYTQQRVGCGV